SGPVERVVKWVKRQRKVAGLWGLCLLLSLVALISLVGAERLVVLLLFVGVWLLVMFLLLRQESQVRDAEDHRNPEPRIVLSKRLLIANVLQSAIILLVILWWDWKVVAHILLIQPLSHGDGHFVLFVLPGLPFLMLRGIPNAAGFWRRV